MTQLPHQVPRVINQGASHNVQVSQYLKQQLDQAQAKIDQMEEDILDLESAS